MQARSGMRKGAKPASRDSWWRLQDTLSQKSYITSAQILNFALK